MNYEYLTDEGVYWKKDLLEKAATAKRFEYSPLGSELKKQADITKKQYPGIDKVYEFDKDNGFKRLTNKVKKINRQR